MLVLIVLLVLLTLLLLLLLLHLLLLLNLARRLLLLLGLGLQLSPRHLWRRHALGGVCYDPLIGRSGHSVVRRTPLQRPHTQVVIGMPILLRQDHGVRPLRSRTSTLWGYATRRRSTTAPWHPLWNPRWRGSMPWSSLQTASRTKAKSSAPTVHSGAWKMMAAWRGRRRHRNLPSESLRETHVPASWGWVAARSSAPSQSSPWTTR